MTLPQPRGSGGFWTGALIKTISGDARAVCQQGAADLRCSCRIFIKHRLFTRCRWTQDRVVRCLLFIVCHMMNVHWHRGSVLFHLLIDREVERDTQHRLLWHGQESIRRSLSNNSRRRHCCTNNNNNNNNDNKPVSPQKLLPLFLMGGSFNVSNDLTHKQS